MPREYATRSRHPHYPFPVHTTAYMQAQEFLLHRKYRWLVTGAAGFIGSHIVGKLLGLHQTVVGVDNLSTGRLSNLADVQTRVKPDQWAEFEFREGDVIEEEFARGACKGADFVLHLAALGSVPRSIKEPLRTNASNVTGMVTVLAAARECGVKRMVYSSSSSVYGDAEELPKTEERIGRPLSPYALTKRVNEMYAEVFNRVYGQEVIGLRYFNVFGPRQDPNGPYAAVIPRWIDALLTGEPAVIFGDGETSRDFCYVANVVQGNVLAAITPWSSTGAGNVYNIGNNKRTTLRRLFELIREAVAVDQPEVRKREPVYENFRKGDVRHSQASISAARECLGYEPTHTVERGLELTVRWYARERNEESFAHTSNENRSLVAEK